MGAKGREQGAKSLLESLLIAYSGRAALDAFLQQVEPGAPLREIQNRR